MLGKIQGFFSSFIPCHLRRQVRELYASAIILNFAVAMVSIFEPVFIFLFFFQNYGARSALVAVLLFYLAVYIGYFLCAPLGAKFAKRYGYEYSIALGTVFTALFYLCLFAINKSVLFFAPAIPIYVLWKIFYWPAFHANFSQYEVDGECGREIGGITVLQSLICVAGPLIGGLLINFFGFKSLFVLSAIIMVLSNVPMLLTKEKILPETFSYRKAYRRLFAKENLKKLLSLFGYGEEFILLIIWPIFMYLVVKNFLELGVLAAIATFATTAIFLYIGKLTDKSNPRKLLRFGTILYFFGWLFRIWTRSVMGVFLIDTFSRITKQTISMPVVTATYKNAHHNAGMEDILFFEMSLVLGKIIALVLGLILVVAFGLSWNSLFILAGTMGLLYLLF